MRIDRFGISRRSIRYPWVSAALVTLMTLPAAAYTTTSKEGCNPITFASSPRVVLHMPGIDESNGFEDLDVWKLLYAMAQTHDRLAGVGASSAAVTGIELSDDALVYGDWIGDSVPTIHVGFTDDSSASVGSTTTDIDGSCNILEAHIQLQNPTLTPWKFGEPEAEGELYYLAEHDLITSPYFRISYLHELLHAFGLAHSDSSYSMMNYETRPFANRNEGYKVMPLPDDVEALRDLYPAAGSRRDLAVLNTWYDPDIVSSSGAASQFALCKPSGGSGWDSKFSTYCGTSPTTEICPGDTLYTRVAAANYGTDSLSIQEKVWFSLDDQYSSGSDIASSTTRSYSIGAQSSSQQGRNFVVPTGLAYNTDYFVIVRLSGTTSSGATVSDWIPLRGTIRTGSKGSCK